MIKKVLTTIIFCIITLNISSQPAEKIIKVTIIPDHKDWTYSLGEDASFDIIVSKNNVPLENIDITIELSLDKMAPYMEIQKRLEKGKYTVTAKGLKEAGFVRCQAIAKYGGKEYIGSATAGYAPEIIKPTTTTPEDFLEFWQNAIKYNSKLPIDAKLRVLPERSTSKVNVYELSIQNYKKEGRVYGILCIPKAPGKYPAVLTLPGAGIRPYNGKITRAEEEIITLEIGIHGIPVTMDPYIYRNLDNIGIDGYAYSNWDNRDMVYFKKVYLGCIRAVDFLTSMPEYDGNNLIVEGGSQGGALAIVTAALDSRVKGLVAFYPALSDLTGYRHNRAGGWPHLFKDTKDRSSIIEKKVETSKYFDVVNFAKLLKVSGFYSFGYNDHICPPTTMYSTYNIISAPKNLLLVQETGHYAYPEQLEKAEQWMKVMIGK